jgi:hypothetical protein
MRPNGSRPTSICVCLAITFAAAAAFAQRIVLLRPRSSDPVILSAFAHLQGELTVQDFEVVVMDTSSGSAAPDDLEHAAEQEQAVAAVSLLRSKDTATADIWISDRVTGKISRRTVTTAPGPEGPSVLAVRAVDLLRASLREFGLASKPPADIVGAESPAPAQVLDWAAPQALRPGFELEAGVALQATPYGFRPAYGPSIALGFHPAARLAVRLLFQGPLWGARYAAANASATMVQEQLMAELGFRFWSGGALSFTALGGVGVHHLAVQGTATAPYEPESDAAWTGLAGVGLGAEVRFAPAAAFCLRARSLGVFPRPVVNVGADRVSFGQPLLQVAGGLDVSF